MEKHISLNLRYLQKKEKLTQNEFGELFGLKKGLLSVYIKNNRCTNFDFLEKIFEHYNLTLDDLFYKKLEDYPELFNKVKPKKKEKAKTLQILLLENLHLNNKINDLERKLNFFKKTDSEKFKNMSIKYKLFLIEQELESIKEMYNKEL